MNRNPRQTRRPAREPKPGKITRVTYQVRNPERASIYLDGEFAFGLPAIEVARRGLVAGMELTAADISELLAVDEIERAVAAALAFVSYRPRSIRETRDRLRQKGYEPPAVDAAIERMTGWGYLDDEAFARWWVENRAEHRPRGRSLLASELRAKGVAQDITSEAVAEAGIDESGAALELARKRIRSLTGLDPATRDRRLTAYLGRRGFGWDVIGPVLKEIAAELDGQ